MNTKSVQVVMSTYNGEKYLKEQIDSILSQEGVDVRLYIRDDGSSDRTTDILASYQEHKNVKIEKGNNLGFAKSFLTALDECDEADYYAFSDQDDVWEKDKLSTAIFNRETGAMSQLAESSTKQWRLADTFVCGRGVPIGKFVRPYLHFKGKEQGRIDLTLTL